MDKAATIEAVQQWPAAERLELVFAVWDKLADAGWAPEPDPELDAELDRRMAAHDANPADLRTWDQIMARLRAGR